MGKIDIDSEQLKKKIEELNRKLNDKAKFREETRPVRKVVKKLEKDCLVRLEKYEKQEEILDGRNSYSGRLKMPAVFS